MESSSRERIRHGIERQAWHHAAREMTDPTKSVQLTLEATLALSMTSRCEATVLGAAIGDAMGHPTEFLSVREIERRFGPLGVQGYELYIEREGVRFAPYTDDTQMAEVVLRTLLEGRAGAW